MRVASLIQQSKFDAKRTVFKQFAEKMSWPITDDLIENRPEPEPDILYKGFESPVAFELSEICAPEVADAISKACRPENNGVWFTATTDPTEYVLRKKVEAPHESLHPMDLLLYWNSRTASPDHLVEGPPC